MARKRSFLNGSRAYLSGPMDFVASRAAEKRYGWRNRIGQVLKSYGVTVFDPWNKPSIRGLHEYGKEDEHTVEIRNSWSFNDKSDGMKSRADCAASFWETMHIDLRMVDISDFVVAYCPTNIYSVGTVHEIVVARQQHKPVLFVSPPVTFPTLEKLEQSLKGNKVALKLLDKLKAELPIKENPKGVPSLWYMPLIGSEKFFDGFGFNNTKLRKKFTWPDESALDIRERVNPPKRPLLPFIEELASGRIPNRLSRRSKQIEVDDDWLLMEKSFESRSQKKD